MIVTTYTIGGSHVYASLRKANQPGGYIGHGRNVTEAIMNVFNAYHAYN